MKFSLVDEHCSFDIVAGLQNHKKNRIKFCYLFSDLNNVVNHQQLQKNFEKKNQYLSLTMQQSPKKKQVQK